VRIIIRLVISYSKHFTVAEGWFISLLLARFVRSHLHSSKSSIDQQRQNAEITHKHAQIHTKHTLHCSHTS